MDSAQSPAAGGGSIDWRRLARPQEDGYDTQIISHVARHRGSLLRPEPWRRRSPEGARKVLLNGTVAVRNRREGGLPAPRYVPASPDHPSLDAAEEILWHWPEAAVQFASLVDTIEVWTDSDVAEEEADYMGSSSHSLEREFGVIMLTIDHPFGIAQSMVHEMAHHKLRALGISLLAANHLVLNDPDELYVSPIITTKKRPMTAVFHAQYSFIHVTALDLAVYHGASADSELKDQAVRLLARNIPRMESGHDELSRHLRTDERGAIFCGAFMDWSREVIDSGRAIIEREGQGTPH
jgi:HEXXH motif-containing protein